jgi:hypothetical protein
VNCAVSGVVAALVLLAGCGRTPLLEPGESDRTDSGPSTSDPRVPVPTATLSRPRFGHTATLLPSGEVLIAGGYNQIGVPNATVARAELYDSKRGTFRDAGMMVVGRGRHTATLLLTGEVLIVGGVGDRGMIATAELYDPSGEQFTSVGPMLSGRYGHQATLFGNGRVLVTGGYGQMDNQDLRGQAEIYDPASGEFAATGAMLRASADHTATPLPDGKVLVVGGTYSGYLSRAELYDPAGGAFLAAGDMAYERSGHTATILANGKVLVAGGWGKGGGSTYSYLASAELFSPASGTFGEAGPLNIGRTGHSATLLSDGEVFVAGGWGGDDEILASTESYVLTSTSFAASAFMSSPRVLHTATLLPNGKVLIAGGRNNKEVFSSAELY